MSVLWADMDCGPCSVVSCMVRLLWSVVWSVRCGQLLYGPSVVVSCMVRLLWSVVWSVCCGQLYGPSGVVSCMVRLVWSAVHRHCLSGHLRPPEDGNQLPKHVVVTFGTP
jgi:hypothetical protein